MRPGARTSIRLLTAAAALTALGAGPAAADPGFDLHIAGPATVAVGQPVIFQVTGTNPPPASNTYLSWLQVDVLRQSAVPSCPANEASQVATNTGGSIIAIAQREEADLTGAFAAPIGFTPIVTGPLLVCAYSVNEEGHTWAAASFTLSVSGGGDARPASTSAPRVTRAASRLVCDPGSWSRLPTRFAYGWLVDGRRAAGLRGRSLPVTSKLRGHALQCSVTASNAAGSTTAISRRLGIR